KDAMGPRKLGCRVIPVAGFRIDIRGREQPALVIVSKGLDGNLRERRKIANLQHGSLVGSPVAGESTANFNSRNVRHRNATDCNVDTSNRFRQRIFLQPTMSSRRTM